MPVLYQGTIEPTDPSGASEGVQAQGPNAGGVVAVDGVAHRVVVVVSIVADQSSRTSIRS